MIYGLTHTQDGQPIVRQTVTTRVSIGLPADEEHNHPEKLDRFRFTSKNAKGEWVEDPELTLVMRGRTQPDQPIREFEIIFLDDDIEKVFRTCMAWWGGSEKKCSGDGLNATRLATLAGETLAKQHPGERYVPWPTCSQNGCPEPKAHPPRCKPSGELTFMLARCPVIGSVAALYTTSYRSTSQIFSSLKDITRLTNGRLAGIPLRLVLKPGKTKFQDKDGKARSSNAFFVHIEFRESDWQKLMPRLIENAVSFQTQVLKAAEPVRTQKMLTTTKAAENETLVEVEHLSEEEEAEIMETEFSSRNEEQSSAPAPDAPEVARLNLFVEKCLLSPAHKEAILQAFGGDLERMVKFLNEYDHLCVVLKATANQAVDWLMKGLGNPDNLLTGLRRMVEQQAETQKKADNPPKHMRKRNTTQKKDEPKSAEVPTPSDKDAPPSKSDGTWNW